MKSKSKTTKGKSKLSHKQLLSELERSIVLFVLSNPRIEHAILRSYCHRHGFVFQEEAQADKDNLLRYGMPLPDKKEHARRAMLKAEAQELYERAQELRAENKAQPRKLAKKVSKAREKNVDRMLEGVLSKVSE
jgi:hypothetical protein